MFSKVNSIGLFGMNTYEVGVECSFSKGMSRFDMVGLPDAAVRESRERITAAFSSSQFALPPGIAVVNLAPADLRKEGASFDLAIALCLQIL